MDFLCKLVFIICCCVLHKNYGNGAYLIQPEDVNEHLSNLFDMFDVEKSTSGGFKSEVSTENESAHNLNSVEDIWNRNTIKDVSKTINRQVTDSDTREDTGNGTETTNSSVEVPQTSENNIKLNSSDHTETSSMNLGNPAENNNMIPAGNVFNETTYHGQRHELSKAQDFNESEGIVRHFKSTTSSEVHKPSSLKNYEVKNVISAGSMRSNVTFIQNKISKMNSTSSHFHYEAKNISMFSHDVMNSTVASETSRLVNFTTSPGISQINVSLNDDGKEKNTTKHFKNAPRRSKTHRTSRTNKKQKYPIKVSKRVAVSRKSPTPRNRKIVKQNFQNAGDIAMNDGVEADNTKTLQHTRDLLRQWLESSIIDFSHESSDSEEAFGISYDDHHAADWFGEDSHEGEVEEDFFDKLFGQDWFQSSEESSEEDAFFACVSSDVWGRLFSGDHQIYRGCEFSEDNHHEVESFRWRRFIFRAPSTCGKGTRRVKRVCRKIWVK